MTALTILNYKPGLPTVRQIEKDGKAWFVAADVCKILEMDSPTKAMRNLDDDEKMTLQNWQGHSGTRGGARRFNIVSESGIYHLAFQSNKPEAKAFRRWVTDTVLPEIRKKGSFALKQENDVLKHDIALYKERDEIFGNKVRPGTISKANGLPRILPRKGTMCAPKSKHTRINAAMYQPLLFDPLTFALMLKDTTPSHPAESAQGTQEVGR